MLATPRVTAPLRALAWRRAVAFHTLVLLAALPWLWARTPGPSSNVVPLLVSWACVAAFAAVAVGRACNWRGVRRAIVLAWLVAALTSSAIGLMQWFGVAHALPFVSPAEAGVAYGNLRQRNQFATLTSLGLLALLWMAGSRRWPPAWLYLAAALLACANAVSSSRTGFVQLLLVAALAGGWAGPRRPRLLVAGCALVAYGLASQLLPAVFFAWHGGWPPTAFERMGLDLGCSSRKVLWANVLHLISLRPWQGWGLGELAYAHYATLYAGPRFCEILDNAHNLPLHIAVELGVPVAAAACGALAWILLRARPWRARRPHHQLAWTAVLVIGVHSLLEYPLWYGPFQVALLASVVLLAVRRWNPVRLRWAVRGAAVLVLAAAAFVQGEYQRVTQPYLPPEQRWPRMRVDPVGTAGRMVLFDEQLHFAELGVMQLSPANAARMHELALEMLHYSPEPPVIEKVIESALMLGRDDTALWHAQRYRAAFPEDYRRWLSRNAQPVELPRP